MIRHTVLAHNGNLKHDLSQVKPCRLQWSRLSEKVLHAVVSDLKQKLDEADRPNINIHRTVFISLLENELHVPNTISSAIVNDI